MEVIVFYLCDNDETARAKVLFLCSEIFLDLSFEGRPLSTIGAVIEEWLRAIFAPQIFFIRVTYPLPFMMPDYSADGDVMLLHELCDELGGAGLGGSERAVTVFAHLDADGVFVAGAFVVGVLALLVGGEALVNGVGIYAEVPGEVAEGVVRGLQPTAFEDFGVGAGTGTRAVALGGMNGDVAWGHG